MAKTPETLLEAIRYFSDPDMCLEFMTQLRWPDGVRCPTCGRDEPRFISTRRLWECKDKHPRKQFSIKVGTIFEDSPVGLDKWLSAIWLIANAKNGVSSYEMHRSLGVTQKTAWFMMHRIRLAMQSETFEMMGGGPVEADETFIGGKSENMHKDRREKRIKSTGPAGKTVVFGLLERHGPDGHSVVRAKVVPNNRRRVLLPEIKRNVTAGNVVYSDAHPSYRMVKDEYEHDVIDHAETYVRGQVHTNDIENFWSLLKRAIKGTYVNVDPFHLFRYLDEEVFRYNNRKDNDGGRFGRAAGGIFGKRLTYAQLTAASTTPA